MRASILPILVVLVSLLRPVSGTAQAVNTQDSLALVDLYNATNNIQGHVWQQHQNWLTTAPVNIWYGVKVTGTRVTGINLTNNRLAGSIPVSIGNLDSLTHLYLGIGFLADSLPSSIGNLTVLTYLDVSHNKLTGHIPASFNNLTLLDTINLGYNKLSGEIPSLANLSTVLQIDLSNNNFTFAGMEEVATDFIFASISPQAGITAGISGNVYSVNAGGTLSNNTYKWYRNGVAFVTNTGDSTLTATNLDYDYYAIITNSNVSNLTLYSVEPHRVQDSLALLDFYRQPGNHGFGSGDLGWDSLRPINTWHGVGVSFGRVGALLLPYSAGGSLHVLSGTLPASLGNLSRLARLNLSNNNLKGPIPPSLGSLINLNDLNLSFNLLSDTIPASLGNLVYLSNLSLTDNNFTGSIPASFGNLVNLPSLTLANTQLSGDIPSTLGNLTKLTYLFLFNNKLTGIPASLGNLVNLTSLELSINQLAGGIPPELGNLSKLLNLNLANNKLTGHIPAELGNLSKLTSIDFSNNLLSDTIPAAWGNMVNLDYINLRQNNFSGNIPAFLGNLSHLSYLYLANNNLSGALPVFNNMARVSEFDISSNDVTGDVSVLVKDGAKRLIETPLINLSNNRFTFAGMRKVIDTFYDITGNVDDNVTYAPQKNTPIYKVGNRIYVSAGGVPVNDTFRLYKDGVLIDAHLQDSGFTVSALGEYNIVATDKTLRLLILHSDTINITSLPVTLTTFTGALNKNRCTTALANSH